MVLLLIPFAALAGFVFLYTASAKARLWSDAIFRFFNPLIFSIPWVGPKLEKGIADLASWISNRLGTVALQLAERSINWVGAMGQYVALISRATITWPIDLISAVRWLVGAEIPRLIHGLPNALTSAFHNAVTWLRSIEHRISRLAADAPRLIRTIVKSAITAAFLPYVLPLRWLSHVWRSIAKTAAIAGGIAVPWIEVPRLRREERAIAKRLGKVERLLGVTALAGVMAGVLGVTRNCLTRGGVGKSARMLCGIPSHLLDDFLSLLADFFVLENICHVLPFLETAVSDIATPLVEALTEVGAGLCDPSSSVAAPFPKFSLYLPAETSFTPSLV